MGTLIYTWNGVEAGSALAEFLANHALRHKITAGTISVQEIRKELPEALALQIFTNRGFRGGAGSFGIETVIRKLAHGQVSRSCLGHCWHEYSDGARSAFQMELMGLDRAVEIIYDSLRGS